MRADVGDRVVLHGRRGTRTGLVIEATEGEEGATARVRWADGGETVLTTGPEPVEAAGTAGRAASSGAKAEGAMKWRRGVTAGLGWEASQALAKLSKEPASEGEPVAEPVAAAEAAPEQVDHKPASGE